jgi:MFS family permease
MYKNLRSKLLIFVYIVTPLLCIYTGETTKLAFLFELKKAGSDANISLLNSLLMSLSLVGVPWIGLFSDKNCRKKTLICLVLFELAALFLLGKSQFIAAILQGLIGAAVVAVSRAAYLDVRPLIGNKDKVIPQVDNSLIGGLAVVETVMVQAVAWVFNSYLTELNIVLLPKILFVLLIFFLMIFSDLRDKEAKDPSNEITSAKKEYLSGYAWQLLVAFFLYDCAFQTPNYFSELVLIYNIKSIRFVFSEKEKMLFRIRQALFISSLIMFSVFLFPFLRYKSLLHSNIDLMDLGWFSTIGGIILALIFIYFTNKVKVHERGFLYGILEEVETFAEAISPVFVYNFLPTKELTNIPFIILIGVGMICIIKYKTREKLRIE